MALFSAHSPFEPWASGMSGSATNQNSDVRAEQWTNIIRVGDIEAEWLELGLTPGQTKTERMMDKYLI